VQHAIHELGCSGTGRSRPVSDYTVESTTETVRSGFLDPTAAPVASVESGAVVAYPNTWTHWGNEAVFGMSFKEREPLRHRYPNGPYSMLGPVEVTGAEPGDVVECSITTLRTIDWGWNSFPLGVGALPHDFPEPYVHYFRFDEARTVAEYTHGIKFPMHPFLGVVGVEPAGDDPVSAILAGGYGGNLVLKDLGVGSHLFLPVQKPGGRVWVGDVHALQGDGVIDQTAIESAAEELTIRYELHKDVALRAPLGETDTTWIVIGFGDSLDDATVACVREVIYWLSAASGISGSEAYALASMSASFRVTQYSNQTGSAYSSVPPKAVHAVIEKSVFPADVQARITTWLRPG
jgi:acetamidase/formamidase